MHVINQTSQQSSHIHQTFGQSCKFQVSIGNSRYFSLKLSLVWFEKLDLKTSCQKKGVIRM